MRSALCKRYNIPPDAVFAVAGTVGVGKSTFTTALAQALGFKVSMEKVDGNPYLDRYYGDFNRWSFHLQVYFLAERFKEQKRLFQYGGGFIQDRSIYEDTAIFAQMNYDNGTMALEDFETYTSLFQAMVMTPYFRPPDLIIYLEGDFRDILERVQKRGRPSELATDPSYWKDLYDRYGQWIETFTQAPVLRLNIKAYDLFGDEDSLTSLLKKISNILKKE